MPSPIKPTQKPISTKDATAATKAVLAERTKRRRRSSVRAMKVGYGRGHAKSQAAKDSNGQPPHCFGAPAGRAAPAKLSNEAVKCCKCDALLRADHNI
jgi:hypothetical protein